MARWTGISLSLIFACTPTKVDEKVFPALPQTCYEVPPPGVSQESWADQAQRPTQCLPVVDAGAAAPTVVMAPVQSLPTQASDAGTDAAATPVLTPPCDAPTVVFSKIITQGGCQDPENGGCHEPGPTGELPDLVSPGVATRLLGGASVLQPDGDCAFIEPRNRTWITAGYNRNASFIWQKINSTEAEPPACGKPMPEDADPLSEEAKACVAEWLEAVAAGEIR